MTTAFIGSPALFTLRSMAGGDGESRSLYDNRVVRRTLETVIDFARLNEGPVRFCLATTDVEAGEPVFFDTAKGDRIGPEHLIASSSLLPAFEPIRIDGRLLADGGLSCNVPLEAEIGPGRAGLPEPVCIVLDLFTPEGRRPGHLDQSAERAVDVFFGMQTRMRLAAFEREWTLRLRLARAEGGETATGDFPSVDLFYLSYRGSEADAGFGKPFDLSRQTLEDRWREGWRASRRVLQATEDLPLQKEPGLRMHRMG